MITVRLKYNPYEKKCRIFFDDVEITAKENRIFAFLSANGFELSLHTFRKRYVIWNGLLPELIAEANDSELNVLFEGRSEDFEKLEQAFQESRQIIVSLGYENEWTVCHLPNYESEHYLEELIQIAEKLKDMCESRAELYEIETYIRKAGEHDILQNQKDLTALIEKHIRKWDTGNSRFRKEKIFFLKTLSDRADNLPCLGNSIIEAEEMKNE